MLAFRLPMDLERIPEPIIVAAVVCVGGIFAVNVHHCGARPSRRAPPPRPVDPLIAPCMVLLILLLVIVVVRR